MIYMKLGKDARERHVALNVSIPETLYERIMPFWHNVNRSQRVAEMLQEWVEYTEFGIFEVMDMEMGNVPEWVAQGSRQSDYLRLKDGDEIELIFQGPPRKTVSEFAGKVRDVYEFPVENRQQETYILSASGILLKTLVRSVQKAIDEATESDLAKIAKSVDPHQAILARYWWSILRIGEGIDTKYHIKKLERVTVQGSLGE